MISVDDILYEIGLSFTSTRDGQRKRKLLYNPMTIFITMIIVAVKAIICICTEGTNHLANLILVNIGIYYNFAVYWKIIILLATIIVIISHGINLHNFKRGIEPTFVRVFQMMSGLVTPKSVGLTNVHHVNYLTSRTFILCKIMKVNNSIIIPIITVLFILIV